MRRPPRKTAERVPHLNGWSSSIVPAKAVLQLIVPRFAPCTFRNPGWPAVQFLVRASQDPVPAVSRVGAILLPALSLHSAPAKVSDVKRAFPVPVQRPTAAPATFQKPG